MRHVRYLVLILMACWVGCSKSDAPAQSPSEPGNESAPPATIARIQPADLKHGNAIVECLAFSPDGSILVTGSSNAVTAWDTTTGAAKFELKGMPSYTTTIAFAKNGRQIACGGIEGTVKLFSPVDGKELRGWKTDGKVQALAFIDGDATVVAGVWNAPTILSIAWRIGDGSEAFRRDYRGHPVPGTEGNYSDEPVALAISLDGKWLASASKPQRDLNVRVWDLRSGQERDQLGITNSVLSLAWAKDGTLAAGDWVGKIRLWDATGRNIATLQEPTHADPLDAIAFSPDGTLIAAGAQRFVDIYDRAAQKRVHSVEQAMGSIRSLAFSPDAKFVALSDNLNNAFIRPAGGGASTPADPAPSTPSEPLWSLNGHERTISALAFSRDGKLLASAGEERAIRIWDPLARKLVLTLEGHPGTPVSLEFSPEGSRLLSAATDQMGPGSGGVERPNGIRLWEVATGKVLGYVETLSQTFPAARFMPDGRSFVAADAQGVVRRFDSTTLRPVGTFQVSLRGDKLRSLAVSPDGRQLAIGYGLQPSPTRVLVCDSETGRETALINTSAPPTSIVFSADGKRIGIVEGMAGIYDAATGKRIRTLEHRYFASGVAFAPDGAFFATAGHDGTMKIWDATTGQVKSEIAPPGKRDFSAMALSPDGRILAASFADEIVLWRHP